MSDATAIFERQAAWQRSRARMSWAEKLRLAVELRKAAVALRGSGGSWARKVAEGRSAHGSREGSGATSPRS